MPDIDAPRPERVKAPIDPEAADALSESGDVELPMLSSPSFELPEVELVVERSVEFCFFEKCMTASRKGQRALWSGSERARTCDNDADDHDDEEDSEEGP